MGSKIFTSYLKAYEFAKTTGGIIQVINSFGGKTWKVYYSVTRYR